MISLKLSTQTAAIVYGHGRRSYTQNTGLSQSIVISFFCTTFSKSHNENHYSTRMIHSTHPVPYLTLCVPIFPAVTLTKKQVTVIWAKRRKKCSHYSN